MSDIRYLNNSGHRWVDVSTGGRSFILVLPDGSRKRRSMVCYEAVGNFAAIVYRHKGKTYRASVKAHDGSEVRDPLVFGDKALPHVFHKEETN